MIQRGGNKESHFNPLMGPNGESNTIQGCREILLFAKLLEIKFPRSWDLSK